MSVTNPCLARQRVAERLLLSYKRWISPLAGNSCRFSPTCSEYAAQAVVQLGWWRGSLLAARRLLRCHPFGSSGYDPAPPGSSCESPRKLAGNV